MFFLMLSVINPGYFRTRSCFTESSQTHYQRKNTLRILGNIPENHNNMIKTLRILGKFWKKRFLKFSTDKTGLKSYKNIFSRNFQEFPVLGIFNPNLQLPLSHFHLLSSLHLFVAFDQVIIRVIYSGGQRARKRDRLKTTAVV